ncbi:Blood vessel epicardial substance [Hondaea fermentalgiana]|uniref:Blood vessel epicardial substance n=1 Tax=Hondaea fermentalgiana TaxID=2315210 RepID=A0A2R5GGT2_9STRA|nr:Blood vessel epicardial substance [Hondaea fermentalgiana]|eukprot:GBG30116.1 Blood vessel epicardial substance [Hondaea fermentalgiana]
MMPKRAEVARQWVRLAIGPERLAWILHAGNVLAVGAASSEDMLQLRSFMACASGCSIGFNLLQARPLLAPAAWGLFFLGLHSYHIRRILLEREPLALSQDEHELYSQAFMTYGFTPRSFKKLLKGSTATWETIKPGEPIVKEGHNQPRAAYVLSGSVLVYAGNVLMNRVDVTPGETHGGWTTHPWRSDIEERGIRKWKTTVVAASNVRLVSFDIRKFSTFIKQDPQLMAAADRLQIDDLRGKLRGSHAEKTRQIDDLKAQLDAQVEASYLAMVRLAVSDGVLTRHEIERCREYRVQHGITDEQHKRVLRSVGWCHADFAPNVCMSNLLRDAVRVTQVETALRTGTSSPTTDTPLR